MAAVAETLIQPPAARSGLHGARHSGVGHRVVLTDVTWDFYVRFRSEFEDRPIRLTFDRGNLEIMTTGRPHELFRKLLAKLIEILLFEFDVPVSSGGSMTFQLEDLKRGFEPDDCWWIAHAADVRGKSKLDFLIDPPPDLAIEIEITSSLVNRVGIYAAMQVPEIWRFDGRVLRFCVLGDDGEYEDSPSSKAFPFLKPEDVLPFLILDDSTDETTALRRFVEWLRTLSLSADDLRV